MDLPTMWFVILGVLLVGYAILDGFDLGVGIVHLLSRGEAERRALIDSIGPFWDGNEVWLVVFGERRSARSPPPTPPPSRPCIFRLWSSWSP